jgi:repressor LexA
MENKIQKLTKKQQEVLVKIRHFFVIHGMSPTLKELRMQLGYGNVNSVRQYLGALEKRGLIRRLSYRKRGIELIEPDLESQSGIVVLPVIASAGCDAITIYADHCFDEHLAIDSGYIPLGKELKSLVLFKAIGKSMDASGIDSGDYVLVQRTDDLNSGDRVVASIGDMAVIKKLKHTENATILEPDSSDPRYKKIILKDDSKIFGKVLDVIKTSSLKNDELTLQYEDGRTEVIN